LEIEFHFSKNIKLHIEASIIKKRFEKIAFFEHYNIGFLNYIFVDDREILVLNKKYLHHSYPTDIITFDYSEPNLVSGDIYISVDTIRYNASKFATSFNNELNRVMIHGLLHLLRYKDKTKNEKTLMRKKEDYYLSLF
jgi:rRNA maturation RNase YbeY